MYRYLTNEAVILMIRIIAESGFLCFVNFFCFPVLCFFVDSAPMGLGVVIPVHLVYAGTMVGAACRMRRPRSLHLKV